MTARDDAIEVGAQALHGDECPDDEHDLCDVGAWDRAAAAVVAAVAPLIRADERAKVWGETFLPEVHVARIEADLRERLRAQVEALIDGHRFDSTTWDTGVPKCRHRDHRSGWSASCPQAWVAKHVLPLLGGESDD